MEAISYFDIPESIKAFFEPDIFCVAQSFSRELLLEAKNTCNNLISSLSNDKESARIFNIKNVSIESYVPSLKWGCFYINSLISKLTAQKNSLIHKRIEILIEISTFCANCIRSKKRILFVPILPRIDIPLRDIISRETLSLYNKIFALNCFLSRYHFVVFNQRSESMVQCIKFLFLHSDQESMWFPRCDAAERMETFINRYYRFDITSSSLFLPSIINTANEIINLVGLGPEYFPTVYLLCYRSAFDSVYPQFFQTGIDKAFSFSRPPPISLPPECDEEISKGEEILMDILFETNPIDIGYQISKLSLLVISNILAIKNTCLGKSVAQFIPAETCIFVVQYFLHKMQFTYAIHLLPMIDRFCTDNDYPLHFKYACQNFRIATIDYLDEFVAS